MLLEEWTVEKEVEVRSHEAWEEGRKEGGKERARRVAQKMKDRGMSINEIMELTDLTVEEVLSL